MQLGLSTVLAVVLILTGCSAPNSNGSVTTTPTTAPTEAVTTPSPSSEQRMAKQPQFPNLPRLNGKATVVLTISGKSTPITIEVDGENAPITGGNFVDLVQKGVYDGLMFHRVIRDPQPFVAQGGDPQSKNPNAPAEALGTGGFVDPKTARPRDIPLEIKVDGDKGEMIYSRTLKEAGVRGVPKLKHTKGAVAMARSQAPDSASSQFYIALTELGFLDGNYAVFGYVTDGMETVDQIQQGDRIESAKVLSGAENLQPAS